LLCTVPSQYIFISIYFRKNKLRRYFVFVVVVVLEKLQIKRTVWGKRRIGETNALMVIKLWIVLGTGLLVC